MIHHQKYKLTVACTMCTCVREQHMACFQWTCEQCAVYRIYSPFSEQYKTDGQSWWNTCVAYMAVIAVRSPLESLLAFEHIIRA